MISIIIPIYNQASKLSDCFESIRRQTYLNYEIIVVNDRSTDRLSKIVNKYKKIFGYRIEFYHNQENHGAPYTRNKGFRYSKGEYVLFLDADSVLKEDALDKMLDTLKIYPEASYVYPNHKFGAKKFRLFPFSAEKLREMPYIHTTALLRRDHFPKSAWDESLKRLQDWDFWLTILKEGHVGVWIDETLFRVSAGGTMSGWMPGFFYKVFPFLPKVKKYKKAVEIVKKKHGLT